MSGKFAELLASKSQARVGLYREARFAYETYVRELGVPFDSMTARHHALAASDDRLAAAERSSAQAVELSRRLNIQTDAAIGLNQLGMIRHLRGDFVGAAASLRESLDILENLPRLDRVHRVAVSNSKYHLGIIALKQGDSLEAKCLLGESLEIDRALGDWASEALSRSALDKCGGSAGEGPRSGADDEPAPSPGEASLIDKLRERADGYKIPYRKSSYNPSQDVIWLISFTPAANELVSSELDKLAEGLIRNLVVTSVAFGVAGQAQAFPPTLPPDSRLCAAILVIEQEGLADANFQYWAKWCVDNVVGSDDFRLFVCVTEPEAARELPVGSWGGELLAYMQETIQLPHPMNVERLVLDLGDYLRSLDGVTARARWRQRRLSLTVAAGRLAFLIQVCCFVMLGAAVAAILSGGEFVERQLAVIGPAAVAVIAGVVLFPLATLPVFLFFRGLPTMNSLLKENSLLGWRLGLFALLGPATIGLPQQLGAAPSWIVLGVVSGVLLDVARRAGRQARRARLSPERAQSYARDAELSSGVVGQAASNPVNPLRGPLFPTAVPSVFISYTTQSDWSLDTASRLYESLSGAGCECFFDRAGIAVGDSWRRRLHESIGDSSVFIAVLDNHSVTREWVAAEMVTALAGRTLTSLPDVIVLMKPELAESRGKAGLPIFRALLDGAGSPHEDGRPRLISVNEATVQTITSALRPYHYHTPSVFPPHLTSRLLLLAIPAAAVGTLGTLFGLPAPVFALLQQWRRYNSGAALSGWGVLPFAYLMCGYWLGFTARLAVASRFEVENEHSAGLARANWWATIGFLLLLFVWAPQVSAPVVGWAAALAVIGWLISHDFIKRTGLGRAGLRRAAPDGSEESEG